MSTLTKEIIEKEFDILKERFEKAKELNLLSDEKYEPMIKEIRLRATALNKGLKIIDNIDNYLDDCDVLFSYITNFYSNIFSLKAGHKDEEKRLKEVLNNMDKIKSKTLTDFNLYFDMFNSSYDFSKSNKEKLKEDVIGYIVSVFLLYLTVREKIKPINKKEKVSVNE